MRILLLLCSCLCAFAGCLPVTGDRIFARDLAVVNPRFSSMPATLAVGFAPTPGAPRIFASAELTKIAHANGIESADLTEACFEIPMHAIHIDSAIRSMRASLPAETEITIVELPKDNVPVGELEFPAGGLEPPSVSASGVQLWHGFVKYTSTRKVPVWARVSVVQRMEAVVTSRDLQPNVPITAQSLHLAAWAGQPVRERVAIRMEDVLGRVPKRALKAGSLIPIASLDEATALRRGDPVSVEVRSGPARLIFSAVAEKSGRDGDLVQLRNPSTGKTFLARLEGTKAVVVVGAGGGL